MSKLKFKFFVSIFWLIGISFHSVFGIPITVSTKFLSKILEFKTPDFVLKIISFLLFSSDIK